MLSSGKPGHTGLCARCWLERLDEGGPKKPFIDLPFTRTQICCHTVAHYLESLRPAMIIFY